MLNINPDGKKMILSLDGGGMRGLISIAMLAELEAMTGKPCHEQFDLVAGTSTGAIIAVGLGLGMSAQRILDEVYLNRLPAAFRAQPSGVLLWLRYLFGGLRHLYDFTPFIEQLAPVVAGKTMGDFKQPIVFMTTRDLRTNNTYYVVSAGPGRDKFADWPVSGAVGASGAAPIFFPPVLGNLLDGGVGVNGNPCLSASIEALEYIGAAAGFVPGRVIHLSIGTGYTENRKPEGAGARFWLYDWINYLINTSLHDTALQQVFTARAIYRDRMDLRRYNPFLSSIVVSKGLGVSLDGAPDPAALSLDSVDAPALDLMEAIGRAYARAVDWTEPGYMPWVQTPGPSFGQGRDGGHPLPGLVPVDWKGSPYR